MLIFMTYVATLPALRVAWDMSATAAGSVLTAFHLAYAASLVASSSLADRVGARRVFLTATGLSAVSALGFALAARSYWTALISYAIVALGQGGLYTTAIMLLADRYPPERRGRAVGLLVASASLGYALSLMVSGLMLRLGGYPLAFLATAFGTTAGAILAWFALRSTPDLVHSRSTPGSSFRTDVLRNKPAMRLIGAYTFHSWELAGMWAWAPAFIAAVLTVGGTASGSAIELGAYSAAAFHVLGLTAASSMGPLSDRLGRRPVLVVLAAGSAMCSFAFGWLIDWPVGLVLAVGAIYGFTALGDSPVLSTALTEVIAPRYLGAALAVRSLLGVLAAAIAPLAFGAVLDAANPGPGMPRAWGWAFVLLGCGGVGATVCATFVSTSLPRSATPVPPSAAI
jgi:MFS family permease